MKTMPIIVLILSLLITFASAQCVPTAIVLSTQAQVDAFPSQYPGCTKILGNVGITGSVQNLDSLYSLKAIGGNLSIINCTTLKNLNGLQALDSIYGGFDANTTSIDNFVALSNLQYIGTNFTVQNDLAEPMFPSFTNLKKINGDIVFNNVNSKSSPLIFVNLDSLNSLSISGFNMNVNSFNNVKVIKGSLTLRMLKEVPLFSNLISIKDNLEINALENQVLTGFNKLTKVINSVYIHTNNQLSSVKAFENLQDAANLYIHDNPALTTLDGFNNLKGNGLLNLKINNNNVLFDINGFQKIGSLGLLQLSENAFLSNISAFDHNIVINNLNITNNPFLNACNVNAICRRVNYIGNLNIANNGPNCNTITEIIKSCPPIQVVDFEPCTSGSQNACKCQTAPLIQDIVLNYKYEFDMTLYQHPADGPQPMCPPPYGINTTSNNPTWIAFIAPCENMQFIINYTNCVDNPGGGDNFGIQAALYSGCPANSVNAIVCGSELTQCINNGERLLNPTGLIPGNIYYLLIDGCAGSACHIALQVLTCLTNTKETIISSNEIKIFPNPTDGSLFLSSEENIDKEDIMIYSAMGHQVPIEARKMDDGKLFLDRLPKGLLLINVYKGGKIFKSSKIYVE